MIAIQVAGAHTAERVKGGTKGLHSERVTAGLGGLCVTRCETKHGVVDPRGAIDNDDDDK